MSANPKLDERMSFMRFDDRDRVALRALKPLIDSEIPGALGKFYGQVRAFPETRGKFRDEGHIAAAERAQANHWRRLTTADYGPDYVRDVERIGRAHVDSGIEPRWYMGGYAVVSEELVRAIVAKRAKGLFASAKSDADLADNLVALNKAVFLDMELAISSYLTVIEQDRAELEAERGSPTRRMPRR